MNINISKALTALILPVVFYLAVSAFTKSAETGKASYTSPAASQITGFTNTILNTSYRYDWSCDWEIEKHMNDYKELNFNGVHMYDWGSRKLGEFAMPLTSPQINYMNWLIDTANASGLRTTFERRNIAMPCYGQRLVYEVPLYSGDSLTNFGFCYRHTDANVASLKTDSGRTVLHASLDVTAEHPVPNEAGWLCRDIYENLQHTDLYYFIQSADTAWWYMKPEMRINPAVFSIDDSTPVLSLVSYGFLGNRIDSHVIRVRNFRDYPDTTYSGQYKNHFDFSQEPSGYNLSVSGSLIDTAGLNFGRPEAGKSVDNCKVDFKIYWYGLVDVWFDKLTVDDRIADRLFSADTSNNLDKFIGKEVEVFGNSIDVFFVDELVYSQYPCYKYVQEKVRGYNFKAKMSYALSTNLNIFSLRNDNNAFNFRLDVTEPDIIQIDAHSITADWWDAWDNGVIPIGGFNSSMLDSRIPQHWKVSNDAYNSYIQRVLGDKTYTVIDSSHYTKYGSSVFMIEKTREQAAATGCELVVQPQLQHWMKVENDMFENGQREPLNEEIQAQTGIAIAHGASSLNWFIFESEHEIYPSCVSNPPPDMGYWPQDTTIARTYFQWYGLMNRKDENYSKRTSNIYGQDKWNYVKAMNLKLLHWKPKLDSITWQSSYSVHAEGTGHEFIHDIYSLYRDPQSPNVFPIQNNDQTKYWEMGFFTPDKANDRSKYFIMVNRRCVPDINQTGDVRQLKIKFDSTQLAGFNNWTVTELDSNHTVATFDKRSASFIDFGIFQPGEGKLYKLAPMMQEGGTLVADEDCGGFEFQCRGEVNNDGHDIAIKPGTEIKFADPSARIIMCGGEFKSGLYDSPTAQVNLTATNGNSWKGLELENCNSVELFNTEFTNVAPYPQDSTYAVEIVDCRHINISGCKFYSELDLETGAVLMNFVSNTDPPIEPEVYLSGNLFKMDAGSIPAVSIVSTGYYVIPALMEWNNFESYTGNSALAILLSNVTGGAIKENNFTGYDKTVFMLGSSIDFYGNYIIGSNQSSVGIVQHSGSNANLSASGEMFTGGYNVITVEGQTAKCIQLTNSYLLIDEGYNNFKLEDSAAGNFHLEGTIPNDLGSDPYPAEDNCFEIGYAQLVKHNLRWIDETPINLDAVPINCIAERPENLIVFNLENGMNDTIRFESGGSGGGERAIRNYELGIKNYENSISENLKESASNAEVVSVKALSDSVSINLRKRNYERVSALCMEMLTDYADSVNDASFISKLYLAELKQDTSSSRMSELKSFLESYILNNPQKEMMIRQAFYFIQKCKVSLGLYESAMTGFQQIINQFPYSYEGLLASWDYAAASLLNSQGGSGGGATSKNEPALKDEGVISYIDDPNDVYDSRKFSTDDRKTLNENLTKTFSSQVNKQTREIKSLEEKVTKNKASNSEKKRYQEMRTLKEVVKARKPETIAMHVSMISDDLSRIMKSTGGEVSDKNEESILPTEFALHQNYPNPFNPATKISIDLPQDSKVSLVVYDLLGREVTRLVNNEFKVAGRYTYDFNGSSLASGIYLCKMIAGGFSETRKMVLIR